MLRCVTIEGRGVKKGRFLHYVIKWTAPYMKYFKNNIKCKLHGNQSCQNSRFWKYYCYMIFRHDEGSIIIIYDYLRSFLNKNARCFFKIKITIKITVCRLFFTFYLHIYTYLLTIRIWSFVLSCVVWIDIKFQFWLKDQFTTNFWIYFLSNPLLTIILRLIVLAFSAYIVTYQHYNPITLSCQIDLNLNYIEQLTSIFLLKRMKWVEPFWGQLWDFCREFLWL